VKLEEIDFSHLLNRNEHNLAEHRHERHNEKQKNASNETQTRTIVIETFRKATNSRFTVHGSGWKRKNRTGLRFIKIVKAKMKRTKTLVNTKISVVNLMKAFCDAEKRKKKSFTAT
jgi:hypothetical protein